MGTPGPLSESNPTPSDHNVELRKSFLPPLPAAKHGSKASNQEDSKRQLPPFTAQDRLQSRPLQPSTADVASVKQMQCSSISAAAPARPGMPGARMCVRVHVVTFNMAGTVPDAQLPSALFEWTPGHHRPDM